MEKGIEGARRIGATWYYWKRTPDRLVKAFGLPKFRRETMKTKDPDEAARLARAYLTELDELARNLDSISSRVQHFDQLSEVAKDKLDADLDARIAKSRFIRLLTAQPMRRRECRSRMTARYNQPSRVQI